MNILLKAGPIGSAILASTRMQVATFEWGEDNGAAAGSPPKGTTRTVPRTEVNWKNIDDSTTAYSSATIQRGNNSFEKFQFPKFTGTFNNILNGLWSHTANSAGLDANYTLKGKVGITYTTPSTTANALLTTDMTAITAIGSGATVLFGATGPEAAGKAASSSANPTYGEWLVTQAQIAVGHATGDTPTLTLTHRYDEN